MAANLAEFFNKKDDLPQVPSVPSVDPEGADTKGVIVPSIGNQIGSVEESAVEEANNRWRANRLAMFHTKGAKSKVTSDNADAEADKGSSFDRPYSIVQPLNHLFYPSSMEEAPMAIYEVVGVPEDAVLRANVMRSKLFGVLQSMGTETRVIGSECPEFVCL